MECSNKHVIKIYNETINNKKIKKSLQDIQKKERMNKKTIADLVYKCYDQDDIEQELYNSIKTTTSIYKKKLIEIKLEENKIKMEELEQEIIKERSILDITEKEYITWVKMLLKTDCDASLYDIDFCVKLFRKLK